MDAIAPDMGFDGPRKRKTRWTRWRRWFSRRPSVETEETHEHPLSKPTPYDPNAVVETDENATTSARVEINDLNPDEVSPTTSKDERQSNEAASDDAGCSETRPDEAESESNHREDSDEDGDEVDTDDQMDHVAEDGAIGANTSQLRDFWAEAWNSNEVGEQRRALLEGKKEDQKPSHATSQKLVDGLIAKTPDKMATYTARWGSDEKTALGRARSILVSALTVKDLIDAGLKFDPTGYGSAAWAVVSFGLTVIRTPGLCNLGTKQKSMLIRYFATVGAKRQGTSGSNFRSLRPLG